MTADVGPVPAPPLETVAGPVDASPEPASPSRVESVEEGSGEEHRVLDATFAKYLRKPCPTIPGVAKAGTWTQLDVLQADAHKKGLFVPHVLARIRGSFSRAGADETLYVIRVGECVSNGFDAYLDVIFEGDAKRPKLRIDYGGWGSFPAVPIAVRTAAGVDRVVRRGEWATDGAQKLVVGDGGAAEWERAD